MIIIYYFSLIYAVKWRAVHEPIQTITYLQCVLLILLSFKRIGLSK